MQIYESFCLWSDLLGYGQNLYTPNWDITTKASLANIQRIKNIHASWIHITNPLHEVLLTLNDGLVRNFDIPRNNFCLTLDWIVHAIFLFNATNDNDVRNGNPGLRGVLAYGRRIKYFDPNYLGQGEFIQTNTERKAQLNRNIVVYSPSELQMNTAFSKAYIIEGSGSKCGVCGNNLYIDREVIDTIIHVSNSGICDTFGTAEGDPLPPARYQYSGTFTEDLYGATLLIQTICGEHRWTSLRITFSAAREYNNEKQSIKTKLYIPLSVEHSLYGPPFDTDV